LNRGPQPAGDFVLPVVFFAARDLLKIGAWLTVVEFLIVIVLVPLYWPLIGIK